jgi:hypothetical protein
MGKDATSALLPGTLELLIPKTLTVGELHGYYKLTAAGRQQMAVEREEFDRVILAIHTVLNAI